MTVRHHPSDETLLRYAAGMLPAGPGVVVATHLAGCPLCRAGAAGFEAVGGALLEDLPPTSLAPDALDRLFAAIDAPVRPAIAPLRPIQLAELPPGLEWPAPLRAHEIGPWRLFGPGMRWSRVMVANAPDANVFMLRIAANKQLLEHDHSGMEYTQVLHGSYTDGKNRYMPGDLEEADAEVTHRPVADADGECICVTAIDGRVQLSGIIGRLLQPFISI